MRTMPNVLAWTMSESIVTLLISCTMEGYASFGSAFIRKKLESLFQFDVQQIYCKYDNYGSILYCGGWTPAYNAYANFVKGFEWTNTTRE